MKYPLLLSLILYSLEATDLTTLLQNAKNNLRVESARLMIDKSQAQLDEARSAYFPTISAAGLYQHKDKTNAFEPRTYQGIEIGAEVMLFDGFRREALMNALDANKKGAHHTLEQEQQNVLMETIAHYFDYLDTKERIEVNNEKKKELDAEVKRFEILVKNDLATTDILKSLIASRLQSEYDHQILQTKLRKLLKELELLSGITVQEPIEFHEIALPSFGEIQRHDLLSDQASLEILEHTEDRYTYMPSLSLSAKHKSIDYGPYDTMGGMNILPENQNEIAASISMTLFDMGRISKEREQAHLDTLKARKLLEYKTKKVQNDADVALLSIQSAQEALIAANSEEEARIEAFVFIKARFEAGLVNSTTYLNELTLLSDARAKARHAKNGLQVAKANAAYTHGIDLIRLVEEKK